MSTWRSSRTPRSQQEPVPVADSLTRVTRRWSMADPSALAAVFSHWESLVGAEISDHAKPQSLHGGVLVLEVDHPAWASQLRFMSDELAKTINSATEPGLVESVRVFVRREERDMRPPRRSSDTPL